MRKTIILLALIIGFLWFSPPAGYAASEEAFSRNLYFGLKNEPETIHLHEFLQREGYYQGSATNEFSVSTRSALQAFQEKKAIYPARGYFGPITRAAVNKMITIRNLENQINELLALVKKLQAEASVTVEESLPANTATSTSTAATTTPALPVVEPAAPFTSTLSITVDYPSLTTTARSNLTMNSLKFTADEPIAIKRLVLTNTGTLADVYIVNIRLIDSKTNITLATMDGPKNQVIEFVLAADEGKLDKGLIISGKTYDIVADIITPSRGAERPKLILDILKSSDISAFDYNDLKRVANLKVSMFPVTGPVMTF